MKRSEILKRVDEVIYKSQDNFEFDEVTGAEKMTDEIELILKELGYEIEPEDSAANAGGTTPHAGNDSPTPLAEGGNPGND